MRLLVVCWAWLVLRSSALADAAFGATALVRRPEVVATHGEDPTASGTSLDLTDRVSLPRTLGDVARESPGARVQRTGGVGAFSSLSLRGADGDETMVMLDEIPLVTPDGGAFDLSLFPPELFARMDVFRGGAPTWLGSAAIGGVLRLVPRGEAGTGAHVSLGRGSFSLLQGTGSAWINRPNAQFSTSVVARAARNDFPYDDEKGTLYDASDDEELRRRNAQVAEGAGLLDLVVPRPGGGRLHLLTLAQGRTAGFPGPGSRPTPDIRRQSARVLSALGYERKRGGAGDGPRRRIQVVASGAYNLDRYTDLYGQLGTSRQWETDDQACRGFVRFAGSLRLLHFLEATAVGSYAIDHNAGENRLAFPQPAPSTRHTAAAALELAARGYLGPVLFELRPSARGEWSRTALHAERAVDGERRFEDAQVLPTARVGGAVQPWSFLALSGSVATGTRLPTLYELFGDRGLVLPSPNLRPVTATSYDAGLTLRGARQALSGSLEARAFLQERRDAIASFRTAQYQVAHGNLPSVRQRGVEVGALGKLASWAALNGSLTYMHTETPSGKRLPFRPQWVAYVRPEGKLPLVRDARMDLRVAGELWHRSFVFVDRANLGFVQECTKAGLSSSLSMFRGRLTLTARVDDVLDARCTDLVGYPLPGRTLFFSIRYQEIQHDQT